MATTHASRYDPLKAGFQDSATYITTTIENEKSVEGWPRHPKSLQQSVFLWLLDFSPHVLLLLLPVGFIGLAIGVARLDGKDESTSGNAILQALAVSATIWPILFAAVLGPLVKGILLYSAQRGTTLGVLEILNSSQTLVSTLRGCFTLRIVSLWPVILVLVWSLSPIGGQGALRAATLSADVMTTDYNLSSYPFSNLQAYAGGPFNSGASGGASMMNQYEAPVSAVFAAQDLGLHHANGSSNNFPAVVEQAGGLPEAVRITQRDLWRNVRIPFIHSLPGYTAKQDEWISVQKNTVPNYSSLIGVPIRGFPPLRSGNASSIIETSYQTVMCNTPWAATQDVMKVYNSSLLNLTTQVFGAQGLPNLRLKMIQDPKRNPNVSFASDKVEPSAKLRILIGTVWNSTICEVSTEYVQAHIRCSRAADGADLACFVEKMRHNPNFTGSGNLTALDIGRNYAILDYIPYTFASSHANEASILEKWLKDPPTAFNTSDFLGLGNGEFWYKNVSLGVFADRFAMVLNTHLRASLQMSSIVGSDGTALKFEDQSWAQTNGTWTEYTIPKYHLDEVWFLLYLISAIVLAICALANIILRTIIYIPDFLGSVSALTRDSNYIDIISPGSTLHWADRSRLLRDKRVMVQDVQPDEVVGRIALSDAPGFVAVRKDRQYI